MWKRRENIVEACKETFSKKNPLHKIFNKNMLKVSYSCISNVTSVWSAHNRNILYPKRSELGWNCRSKAGCPLENKCLSPKIVYQADVRNDTTDGKKFYLRFSEKPFRERFRNDKSSNINEVIRAVLNSLLFFYQKILHTHTRKT